MRNKNNLQGLRSIVSQIYLRVARLIRNHKIIAIVFIAGLLIIMFSIQNTYSVGSCHKQSSIKIVDETNESDIQPKSTRTGENSSFQNYVNTISRYTFNKIDEIGQCRGDLNSDPQVELVFVYRPLESNGITPLDFKQMKSSDTRYLDSPWVKLSITKSNKFIVRAVFIWNQRQFLLDQAVLSGAQVSSASTLLPLDNHVFTQYLRDYRKYVFSASSDEAKSIGRANLSKQLPADIMWLLNHSGNFDGRFLFMNGIGLVFRQQQVSEYIDLTKELLNRRFTSLQAEQQYDSILDLKDVYDIDKYRIDKIWHH
jgi:hypothetical protein